METKPKVSYEQALALAKKVSKEFLDEVDFIFMVGWYRIEFHTRDKTFVVESRDFDRVPLIEEEDITPMTGVEQE